MNHKAYEIKMEIAGPTFLCSRPDSGDNPISYPVPTYSMAKGLFEAVLWGPAVEVIPKKVEVCAPIQWHGYVEHTSILGSCPDYLILDALTPERIGDPAVPSESWRDYRDKAGLPDDILKRVAGCVDLVNP